MNKIFSALSAAIMAAMFISPAAATDIKTAAQATYKIYDGDRGMCSSTFYRNDPEGALFITAGHCVDSDSDYNLREQKVVVGASKYEVLSEKVYHIKTVKLMKAKDVALIQLKDSDVTFDIPEVDIATPEEMKDITIGTPVMAVGYPAGLELTITTGEFTAMTPGIPPLKLEGPLYRFTATVIGGNSGGGLYAKFGDEWKYVGTVNAIINPAFGAGMIQWGTTPETIDQLLTGFRVTSAGKPTIGLKSSGSLDDK